MFVTLSKSNQIIYLIHGILTIIDKKKLKHRNSKKTSYNFDNIYIYIYNLLNIYNLT